MASHPGKFPGPLRKRIDLKGLGRDTSAGRTLRRDKQAIMKNVTTTAELAAVLNSADRKDLENFIADVLSFKNGRDKQGRLNPNTSVSGSDLMDVIDEAAESYLEISIPAVTDEDGAIIEDQDGEEPTSDFIPWNTSEEIAALLIPAGSKHYWNASLVCPSGRVVNIGNKDPRGFYKEGYHIFHQWGCMGCKHLEIEGRAVRLPANISAVLVERITCSSPEGWNEQLRLGEEIFELIGLRVVAFLGEGLTQLEDGVFLATPNCD